MKKITSKNIITIVSLMIILIFVNLNIVRNELLISRGESIFLELAPVDPRSIMQGDYMILNYRLSADLRSASDLDKNRYIVVELDEENIATFKRLQNDREGLKKDERVMKYKLIDGRVFFGGEDFFFQEGLGEAYERGRYSEFKVSPSGETILVDLRSDNLELIDLLD